MIRGQCHCGAIILEIIDLPATLIQCTCSICHRYGAQWAYGTTANTVIIADPDALRSYIWGDRCIEFYHCQNCGCLTHYESLQKTERSRVAINARMFDRAATLDLPLRTFDGADAWEYLD